MTRLYRIPLARPDDLDGFRRAARALVAAQVPPENVLFSDGSESGELFGAELPAHGAAVMVPSGFAPLAEAVICHRDPERFALLYRLLWRLTHGERALLLVASDPLVHRLTGMQKAVRRDRHKMTAFLRFRPIETPEGEHSVAWFEPDHHILRNVTPFFIDRFAAMRWTIVTPEASVRWDGAEAHFGPGAPRDSVRGEDGIEDWWLTYYRATFNPARVNRDAMRAEMPKKYWRNLPEASLIPELIDAAQSRTQTMIAAEPTMPRKRMPMREASHDALPAADAASLPALAAQTKACTRCPLHRDATQTVFGEGPENATVVFVGEQPGDHEDLAGRPFVGPAGQVFDRALKEAGIERARVYVTNAVKHFKYELRGKRRIHQRPNAGEVEHCRWWLDRELALIRPQLVVALGATAARALTGRAVGIEKARGQIMPFRDGRRGLITVHPSYLLRLPDPEAQATQFALFVQDLRIVAQQTAALAA